MAEYEEPADVERDGGELLLPALVDLLLTHLPCENLALPHHLCLLLGVKSRKSLRLYFQVPHLLLVLLPLLKRLNSRSLLFGHFPQLSSLLFGIFSIL